VTVVFFGYTQCPDVCPTTLAELAEVKQAAGRRRRARAGRLRHGRPRARHARGAEGLRRQLRPDFVALRGTPEETARPPAKQFKVFYKRCRARPTSYTIDHTAGSYVFDAQGKGAPVHALRQRRRGAGGTT
jgi:protein SCO1/2